MHDEQVLIAKVSARADIRREVDKPQLKCIISPIMVAGLSGANASFIWRERKVSSLRVFTMIWRDKTSEELAHVFERLDHAEQQSF